MWYYDAAEPIAELFSAKQPAAVNNDYKEKVFEKYC